MIYCQRASKAFSLCIFVYLTIISALFAIVISCGCYFLGGFGRLFDGPEIYKDGAFVCSCDANELGEVMEEMEG